MKPEQVRGHVTQNRTIIFLIGAFILALAAVSVPVFSARSGSAPADSKLRKDAPAHSVTSLVSTAIELPEYGAFLPEPLVSPEAIYTFASDCTTPKTDWNLGETVCAKANGVPLSLFPWRVILTDPAGFVRNSQDAIADDNATYTFVLPSSATSFVNGQVVDNRGNWRVELVRSSGARRQTSVITVHQTSTPVANVSVLKIARDGDATASVGGSLAFLMLVSNDGPDTAQSVHLIDSTPSGSTLVSFSQQTGPACLPVGNSDCTMASMTNGETAEFTAVYQIGGSPGDILTSATVSSTTFDSNNGNNSSTAQFTIAAGGAPSQCTLVCPTSLTFSEDPGTGGHVVASANFPNPVTTGTCGDVSMSASPNPQTNNYFFPVGISVITASTESGEECTFTVTVTDNDNPTINCPGDITTFESSPGSGSANVNYNVTANDNSGSVTVTCNIPSGDSFPVGTTEVTCTAADESNNTATCQFNVTVTGVNSTCVLTTQPSITVDSPANACGANVTYTTPTSDGSGTCGTITCDRASGSFFPVGDTVVTCTSSPDGGSTSFTVTVNDVTAPTPTLASLPTLEGTCSVTAGVPVTIMTPTGPKVVIELPTASDNCGGTISASTNDERTYDTPGSHVVTWNYTDASGNTVSQPQTVIVTGTDNAAPVPDVANLPVATDECEVSVTPPTATDNCAGTVAGTTTDPLTYVGAGTYTIHWTYTDGTGNFSTQNQTVVVTDTHAPTIALVGASSITVECHTSFSDPGVTTEDNCVPKNVSVAVTGQPNVNVPNTYIVTYTATDGGGNQASVQRTVIVEDTLPPTISCQANIIADFDPAVNGAVVNYVTPVGVDSCGAATTQVAGLPSGSTFPVGTTTNTFTVTDGANHTASCSFNVTVALTSLIGLDSVTITGSAYADSYSSAGGYPATKGSQANILSNGTITMGNSAKVWGNVRSTRANVNMTGASQVTGNATAGTTVTTSGSASVGGTRTNNALAPVMTLPSVSACGPYSSNSGISGTYSYNQSTGNLTLSGVNIATLANGTYCFNNVTLGNASQLKVNGPVVIKLTGILNTSGASSLNNTTQIPNNLRILSSYTGSNGVILGNSASVYAVIYSPRTGLNISGAAPLFGTAAAKTLTMGNSGAIHYDTQLTSAWPALWVLILGP